MKSRINYQVWFEKDCVIILNVSCVKDEIGWQLLRTEDLDQGFINKSKMPAKMEDYTLKSVL